MKNLLDYIRYSSIALTIQLNPIAWLKADVWWGGPDDTNPGMYEFHLRFLMIRFNIQIDNGSW